MVSMKDTAKADSVSLSEYLKTSRELKLKKSQTVEEFKCQLCPYSQYASENHLMCPWPRCVATAKVRR